MSDSYPLNCDICGFDNEVTNWNRYGSVVCKQCGQHYEYDELMMIVLTDEQLALLAADYKRRTTVDIPWINGEKPPNEEWVEVKSSDGTITTAKAFYGRDGWMPHWQTVDGTSCHPSKFNTWRRNNNISQETGKSNETIH